MKTGESYYGHIEVTVWTKLFEVGKASGASELHSSNKECYVNHKISFSVKIRTGVECRELPL